MNEKVAMIYTRNVLVVKMLWVCLLVATIFNLIIDAKLLYPFFPIPAAYITITIITWLVLKKIWIKQTMLFIITITFVYLSTFTIFHPTIHNFSFIWAGLVFSAVYQEGYIIVIYGLSTVGYINYFYYTHYQDIFANAGEYVNIWLSLTAVFITIILFFKSRFSEKLRLRAEQNESGALEKLKTSQEYLDGFINNMTDAACITNFNGNVIRVNKAFEEMYGFSEKEFIYYPFIIMPNAEIITETMRVWQQLKNGEKITSLETIRKKKDGNIININITFFQIYDSEGEIVAIASIERDITENKQKEEFLINADKLNAIGQLAAGVAHEIRNPLTTIIGFIQLLQRKNKKDNEHYGIILSELDRINFITNEFLALAKPHMVIYSKKNIVTVVKDVIIILNTRSIITNVEILTHFTEDDIYVKCDENKLKQVFINIIKNGIEAMPEGGKLRISIEKGINKVKLKFVDHGCGIAADKIKSVGEPFFTTKDTGNGLGVVVSKKIIDDHEGIFNITSQVKKGTCVEILLPLADDI